MSLPPLRVFVLGSTENVHSASLPLVLPATTMLSAAALFTVPLALCVAGFFSAGIAAGFSVFFSSLGAAVVLCARTDPDRPATKATPMSSAMSFFTGNPPVSDVVEQLRRDGCHELTRGSDSCRVPLL